MRKEKKGGKAIKRTIVDDLVNDIKTVHYVISRLPFFPLFHVIFVVVWEGSKANANFQPFSISTANTLSKKEGKKVCFQRQTKSEKPQFCKLNFF
jgi:hypothetical protein